MACYSQTGLLQSLDILYKIQYTRVEGDVYAIALHETSLLSVYLLVRGLYFYLHTRFSCHRLPKLYANFHGRTIPLRGGVCWRRKLPRSSSGRGPFVRISNQSAPLALPGGQKQLLNQCCVSAGVCEKIIIEFSNSIMYNEANSGNHGS